MALAALLLGCRTAPGVSDAESGREHAAGRATEATAAAERMTAGVLPADNPSGHPDAAWLPFALVELFTSEGCSSCPPADENLRAITESAERTGARVFALELHVDYWDSLGWVDPFSSPVHSLRQRQYATALGSSSLYTPQMLVNGTEALLGSSVSASRAAIARALAQTPRAGVSVTAAPTPHAPGSIRVDYHLATKASVDLHLAVAQDAVTTQVLRGENANQNLRHRHVVRAFWSGQVVPNASGSWTAPWPDAASRAPVFVVAYVSDPSSRAVLGAHGIRYN